MAKIKNKAKTNPGLRRSATEVFSPKIVSEARALGRRFVMRFLHTQEPRLDRLEYHGNHEKKSEYLQYDNQEDKTRSFRGTDVAIALPMFMLDSLCGRLQNPPQKHILEGGAKTPAAALRNALKKNNGTWYRLFTEYSGEHGKRARVGFIFGGLKQEIVFLEWDFLAPDCFEIFWNEKRLNSPEEIRHLAAQFRKAWKVPPPMLTDFPEGEVSPPPEPPAAPTPPPKETKSPEQPAPTSPAAERPKRSDAKAGGFEFEFKTPSKQEPVLPTEPPPTKIDPRLFEIQNPDELEWNDSDPLINFGIPGSDEDVWKIRDANEGVLIFGAVGSGKTSGSGSAVATALLQAGYGGLVLTAKTDEAERWLRLCERTGRAADCIHITPRSGHKLNVLRYEIERPGERLSVTDDLVALLRCINGVVSRSKRNSAADDFWTLAPNKLMKNLFEIFYIAREPFSINNFTRFINRAALQPGKPWQQIEYFSKVITAAQANAQKGSEEDQRMFAEAFEYWTKSFAAMPDITRGGVVASFDSMAEIMNGRGIYEMLCTETNLTPETILSGKIVILDFPVKESSQGGLMVQATWKLLFEQAIERRTDKNKSTARPVFLWEDEGHEFFSQHDVRFQPTARDCRACHVIMSQNLHNFYHLGHGNDAVQAV